jgi:hypothetical protein
LTLVLSILFIVSAEQIKFKTRIRDPVCRISGDTNFMVGSYFPQYGFPKQKRLKFYSNL